MPVPTSGEPKMKAIEIGWRSSVATEPLFGIGSPYLAQAHKIFQTRNGWRLPGCMQTKDIRVKRFSIGQIVDHLNQAFVNVDRLGSGGLAIIISGVLLLISLVQHASHSGANNGGI
jgi:hypothetical protein